MEEEVAFLREKIDVVSKKIVADQTFYIGHKNGNSIVVVKCGIGKVNAAICTQILIDLFAVDQIINIGVAGALHPDLKIGDIVISKDAVQHDMDASIFGDPIGNIPRMEVSYFPADETLIALAKQAGENLSAKPHIMVGRVASGDQFISTTEGKKKIRSNVKGDCAEMEGAAIAHACYVNRIPFLIIRSISDQADDGATMDFAEFTKMAVKNTDELIDAMLSSLTA